MAEVITMPKLGFDMAEGTLIRWVKREGEKVDKGEVLAEIETDKATVEVEAAHGGVVYKHLVPEGTTLPVGSAIAVLIEPGEEVDLESLLGAQAPAAAAPAAAPEAAAAPDLQETPAAQTGERGGLPGAVKASPVARRLARERGLDLAGLQGSGPGGRIVKRDVEAAIAAVPAGAPAISSPAIAPREPSRVPLTRLRGAIGRRMTRAKQETPHFYVTVELDAAPAMALRAQLNALLPEGEKLSVNDLIVKAAALALREFPNLNASLEGDEIVRHGEVNVGLAVAVEDGLLTVVVRDADLKPLRVISRETREMVARARDGRVRPQDVEGSTFTVSNLGMFDVEHFIAIINPPEAAILAVGSVLNLPVVRQGEVVPGKRLKVTLSADHRVTDGAEAARWLQVFREKLEQPLQLML